MAVKFHHCGAGQAAGLRQIAEVRRGSDESHCGDRGGLGEQRDERLDPKLLLMPLWYTETVKHPRNALAVVSSSSNLAAANPCLPSTLRTRMTRRMQTVSAFVDLPSSTYEEC